MSIVASGLFCFIMGCSESGDSVVSNNPETTGAAPSPYVNSVCPIMGNEIEVDKVAAESTRDWNGKKVAFCCPPCLEEWDDMTEEEKTKAIANPPKKSSH
jgi:hypothetical protein